MSQTQVVNGTELTRVRRAGPFGPAVSVQKDCRWSVQALLRLSVRGGFAGSVQRDCGSVQVSRPRVRSPSV
jgi:hypothetical protein